MDKALEDRALAIKARMTKFSSELYTLYSEAEDVRDEIDDAKLELDEEDPDAEENAEAQEYEAASSTMQDWMCAIEQAAETLDV